MPLFVYAVSHSLSTLILQPFVPFLPLRTEWEERTQGKVFISESSTTQLHDMFPPGGHANDP